MAARFKDIIKCNQIFKNLVKWQQDFRKSRQMATRFSKILSDGNKILKSKLMTAPSYMIIFNFSFPFSIAASQLITHLSMNECPFVLMILISFFTAARDLEFEDPYLIKSIKYQFKSMLYRYLCSKMNKQSANEKMEEYMRMVKLLENVEEVLKNPICNKKQNMVSRDDLFSVSPQSDSTGADSPVNQQTVI